MRIEIHKCPVHDFWAIMFLHEPGTLTRFTPGKCCGRWETVRTWDVDKRMAADLAEMAAIAEEEAP